MKIRYWLPLTLLLGGCVTQAATWAKPGATATDLDRDKLQCQYEAKKALASRGSSGIGIGAAIADGIDEAERQKELQTLCLQTKGYTLKAGQG